jgi:hypothetical protein
MGMKVELYKIREFIDLTPFQGTLYNLDLGPESVSLREEQQIVLGWAEGSV